jgi:NADH:ubiquinone oxidoreductase subunit C
MNLGRPEHIGGDGKWQLCDRFPWTTSTHRVPKDFRVVSVRVSAARVGVSQRRIIVAGKVGVGKEEVIVVWKPWQAFPWFERECSSRLYWVLRSLLKC